MTIAAEASTSSGDRVNLLVPRTCSEREAHVPGLFWRLGTRCLGYADPHVPAIIAAFAITDADAGLIGTVTLLTSAVGGWGAGMPADKFGRVRTLQITVVWFAFFTFLCGSAQSYPQLLVLHALMGLG